MAQQPASRDLHVDQLLTNASIGYKNAMYIADQIFPELPVTKQSDILTQYDQSAWFRNEVRTRAPGTKSRRSGWTVDTTLKYFCDRYSFGHEIADETRDNADAPFNLDLEATDYVTDKQLMGREVNFATSFMTTGKWGTDVTGAANADFTQWSDYANSQPFVDITTYEDTIEGTIGRSPNTFVMGKQVWSKLKWHPDLVDTIKYTERGIPGPDLLTAALDLGKVLIGRAITTTDPEGTAEASVTYSRIWGKKSLLLYVPAAPSLMTPAAGYTFIWTRVAGALQYIKRMRDEEREVDIVESNGYWDQQLTAKKAGVYLAACVA